MTLFSLNLSDLNGSNGFVLNGVNAFDDTGSRVSRAGDVNGDGFDDVVISAPEVNNGTGAAYVVFGNASGFASSIELSSLDGTNGFVLTGANLGDTLFAVATAGDINGDGIDDLILGASYASPGGRTYAGASYVVFGQTTGFSASLSLGALNGANGFVLNGVLAGDYSGFAVSGAGDVNGDGIDDVIIGAYGVDFGLLGDPNVGAAYVVFGHSTGFDPAFELSTLNGTNGFVINGRTDGAIDCDTGYSVSAAGDVNGDGFDDVIVSARDFNPGGQESAGQSYVIFGTNQGLLASLNVADLNGTNGFIINGIHAGDYSGESVSAAGDVNGDGYDDLIIGAYGADPGGRSLAGESYVVFGHGGAFAATLELSSLNGTNGFTLHGIAAGDYSGYSVSDAGDVNGDGFDDLIIGAYYADPDGKNKAGQTFVVFGKAGGFAASIELSTLDGTNGFALNGVTAGDQSGYSVSGAGDVNGDGFDDLIIGAYYANNSAGASYVVFGRASFIPATEGNDVLTGSDIANDSLSGLGGNDALYGQGGVDTLDGGAGNDTLIGGAGDDVIVGGDGIDIAVIGDLRRAAAISEVGDDHTLQSAEGTDAIDGSTEIISFLDGKLYFGVESTSAEVNRMYLTTLDRGPDAFGLAYWTHALEAGTTLLDLANTFLASPEWQAKYGALDNGTFVTALYNNVLDRDPDQGGYDYWTGLLDANSLSRPQLVLNFSESPEFKQNTSGDVAGGLWAVDDDAAFVLRAYQAGLDRQPDAGGLAYWIEALHDGAISRQQIADAFAAAPEFVQTYGALTNQQFVEQMYLNALDRAGDTPGVEYWTAYLDGGASRGQVVTVFAESQELIANTQHLVADGLFFL